MKPCTVKKLLLVIIANALSRVSLRGVKRRSNLTRSVILSEAKNLKGIASATPRNDFVGLPRSRWSLAMTM